MDWTTFNRRMPWNVLFILGGGFALAKGVKAWTKLLYFICFLNLMSQFIILFYFFIQFCMYEIQSSTYRLQVSGLGDLIGQVLASGSHIPGWAMVLLLCVFASVFTEFNSNAASVTLLLPIVTEMVISYFSFSNPC